MKVDWNYINSPKRNSYCTGVTTRRIVLHKALWNFNDTFTSSSHKLLPFTPLPISSHPCHPFHGFQATRSSQWCCYSTEIRLTFSMSCFCSSDCLNFPVTIFSCVFWGTNYPDEFEPTSVHDAPGPTMDPMGSKILIHWSTTQQIDACVPSSPSLIFSLAFSKSTSWNVDTGREAKCKVQVAWNVPWGPHVDLFSQ